ncbi:MAG: SDR family NAD(P)-dependent oxidoreductase, partial [Pseudomonadales bacterium]
MKDIKGKVVALTGASSGIGRALANILLGEGCHLALADKNMPGLEETLQLLKANHDGKFMPRVTLQQLDVSEQQSVLRWADDVVSEHGHVDIVINNAGVSSVGSIEETSFEEFDWVFDIVFYGVLYGCKAFL